MGQVQSYFDDIAAIISHNILEATSSIRVALAYFTDKQLLNLLCLKAEKGTQVQLVVSDEDINFRSGLDFNKLTQAGGEVFFSLGSDEGVMHHKFCILDDIKVITGSYNWSQRAKSNRENVTIVEDVQNAARFLAEFEAVRDAASQLAFNRESYHVPTGIVNFDNTFVGLHAGSCVVLTSPAKNELSAFALSIVGNVLATTSSNVAYISLQEDETQVMRRLLAVQGDLSCDTLINRPGHLGEHEFIRTIQTATGLAIHDGRLRLNTLRGRPLDELANIVTIRAMANQAKLIVIDGTESMNTQRDFPLNNRFDSLEPFYREIKRLALSKHIPIVCLLHSPSLDRNRGHDPELRLGDLGLLAGVVDTIYSMEKPQDYYSIHSLTNEEPDARHIVALKNRYGVSDRIKVYYNPSSGKFSDAGSAGEGWFQPQFA